MAFLEREGLADAALMGHFQLGFADRTLGRFATARDEDDPCSRASLAGIGALRSSGHEHLVGCLVVPLIDADGSVRQCVGHRIASPRSAPTPPRWLLIDWPRIWNLSALEEPGDVVVCDDVLEAILVWRAGHRRVIACARDVSESEIALLAERVAGCGAARVRLAFPGDTRGHRLAQKVGTALEVLDIQSLRVPLPRGYDLRVFAQTHRPAAQSIDALLRGVLPIEPGAHAPVLPAAVDHRRARGAGFSLRLRSEIAAHLETLGALGLARSTIAARRLHLRRFAATLARVGVRRMDELTETAIARFRLELGRARCAVSPPSAGTQANAITAVRMFCDWAVRTKRLAADPAIGLARPSLPRRLPRAVLSASEAERVLSRPDITTRSGVRDRAIMEVLYSTGIRRMELVGLELRDLDADRGVLFIREGKGRKDRWVPIGDRAVHWVHRYLDEVRPRLLHREDPGSLFLNARGRRIRPSRLTERLHGYVLSAGVGKPGSCHIFRHTMATLMHDGGADIRDLQEILGHAQLTTTQRYTHVSLSRLKAVHTRTHPARYSP